jgi:hypothetical protein
MARCAAPHPGYAVEDGALRCAASGARGGGWRGGFAHADAHTASCPGHGGVSAVSASRPGRAATHRVAAQTRDPCIPDLQAIRVWAPDRRRTVPLRFTLRRIRGTRWRMARCAAPHPGHAVEDGALHRAASGARGGGWCGGFAHAHGWRCTHCRVSRARRSTRTARGAAQTRDPCIPDLQAIRVWAPD